jgi:chaperonin cofactor prefoldin
VDASGKVAGAGVRVEARQEEVTAQSLMKEAEFLKQQFDAMLTQMQQLMQALQEMNRADSEALGSVAR